MRKLNYDVIQNSRFPFYSKIKTFIFFFLYRLNLRNVNFHQIQPQCHFSQ